MHLHHPWLTLNKDEGILALLVILSHFIMRASSSNRDSIITLSDDKLLSAFEQSAKGTSFSPAKQFSWRADTLRKMFGHTII